MRRAVQWVAVVVVVAAAVVVAMSASVVAEGKRKPQTDVTYVTTPNEYDRGVYAEVKINGRRCIVMRENDNTGYGAGAGISCDWTAK